MIASVMLMFAVLASLALGVLLAHAICMTMFRVFRVQSLAAAQQRASKASAMQVITEA